jgi:sialate O-acetylesterase
VEFKDGEAIVTVENVEWMGLCPGFVPGGGFELAGEDKVFHPATGVANKYTITVSSDDVPAPVAVRYCFHNWTQATLFSAWGIPLLPFRTDNWEYDYNYKRK